MTTAPLNAFSLAVAVAISSSILATQALADRRLQTKSVDVSSISHEEFTHSEVMVRPTLGHDQQPIPKSFTTTYPDQTQARAGYEVPSEGFTDVLSGIEGGVSSVDLFETDENDVAQKYTKILKVGDEGIFRFTHNLEEYELVIEVRGGMTDQDSIAAVRSQSGNIQPLEPLTKVASPEQLAAVLRAAHGRAGNLGASDNYVSLATIEVKKVAVNGRTFMRLIASGDHPPELQRLGQSLFVNDEALLAAATSAYAQVHILGEDLQHKALNKLLSYHKPVGYIVHVEDDRQVYPVPIGYPKLEVTEASGEKIVFRGQKENPTEIAVVRGLYEHWYEPVFYADPPPDVSTQVKKDKVKSYLYVTRNRQMELLEAMAANPGAEFNEIVLELQLCMLAYYESLQQALISASPDNGDEFELTLGHIRVASSLITPFWIYDHLLKNFGFNPILRNILSNPHLVKNIQKEIPDISDNYRAQVANPGEDEQFASKVINDMSLRQRVEFDCALAEKQAKEAQLAELNEKLKIHDTHQAEAVTEQFDEVAEKEVAGKARFANIENFDSNEDIDVPQELLLLKYKALNEQEGQLIRSLQAAKAQINLVDSQISARKVALKKELDDIRTPDYPRIRSEVIETLSAVHKALKMPDFDQNDDVYLHRQYISEDIQKYIKDARQRAEEEARDMLDVVEKELNIKANEEDYSKTRLTRIVKVLNKGDLSNRILDRILFGIETIILYRERRMLDMKDLKLIKLHANLHYKAENPDPNKPARKQRADLLEAAEKALNLKSYEEDGQIARLARVHAILDSEDLPEHLLDQIDQALWQEESTALNKKDLRIRKLCAILNYKVEDSYLDKQVKKRQTGLLQAVEKKLYIHPRENLAAWERGKAFTAKLARDLNVAFAEDDSLAEQSEALREKIEALIEELYQTGDDEGVRRTRNNDMAYQLNIEDYEEDAIIDDQNSLIEKKLGQLDEAVMNAGLPDVNERIAAIENELDWQMAQMGPKPRYVLDREVATAKREIEDAIAELETVYRRLAAHGHNEVDNASGELPLARKKYVQITEFLREHDREGMDETDAMPGGAAAPANQESTRLKGEIETRKANIERMREVLRAAEKAVENDGGSFQYTPEQAEVRAAMEAFIQQHPFMQQALEAGIALAESAAKSGKVIRDITTFDFGDEFAPIRLQAMAGDNLMFNQASRIVAIFKSLRTKVDWHQGALIEIQRLVYKARNEIGKGAQQYDDEIRGMGKRAIHFIEHEPEDLKSFSEYFATRSASGNKIMVLLREGLISKVELENYMKTVRGVGGYQTVAEFEHFLGNKHGVKVPEFRKVVQMLSDESAEAFMQSVFAPVTVTATGPAGMKESIVGMKEYAAAVVANYVLDDIAFENGRRTAAFLTNIQDTLTPYASAAGLSESDLIKAIHDTLMQAHAATVEWQLKEYWVKPSAFLVQAVTWYFSSYKPLLATHTVSQANALSLSNMSYLYLLDLTNRGDYLHRMLTPFQHWLERYSVDLDRTGQYAYHRGIEQISEVGGLAMPLGKAASSVILLKTGSMLFARQVNANPHRYRSIVRLVPEIVKSMGSGQGIQVALLHRATPQKVKTLASATAGLVLGPVATVGAYAHSLISGFTYAQTFGFALASSLAFDFFMNDNKMLTQWLGGPLGRSLDKINRWRGVGETDDEYLQRTAIALPQGFSETDEEYASRVKANNSMYGWTRHENYLQFRERRDRTMKLFDNGWEKYFRENVPKWSFSHAESVTYSYTLGAFYEWQKGDIQKVHDH
ncbi:hypothetical protein [Endozoicomonas sp. ALC020]|uniref:hypothetical protein n=1 Tax=unclassified Endozoicomonas TaxID=2644528 RepID=UPI003BB1F58D